MDESSSDFQLITRYLRNPIPTLRRFRIVPFPEVEGLELPSGVGNAHFLHARKLYLEAVLSLRVPHIFPRVTELKWEHNHASRQVFGHQ